MNNQEFSRACRQFGWTGGQYSLYRAFFGLYLLVHFAALIPWGAETFSREGVLPDAALSPFSRAFPNLLTVADTPAVVAALLTTAAAASILFILGKWDRAAAIWMWYVLACLFGRNPLSLNPSLPFVGWLLLAHALLDPAPFGALSARGRADPAGGWRLDRRIHIAAWIIMSLAYTYSGYTKLASPSWLDGSAMRDVLENPLARDTFLRELLLELPDSLLRAATWGALVLELAFAPLTLVRRIRPWLWTAALGMHLGLIALVDFADLSLGMIMIHLFTFQPAWLPTKKAPPGRAPILFYDGECGLCHRAVRFVMAEDRAGIFRFSPLQGDAFARLKEKLSMTPFPDSMAIQKPSGRVLTESRAVVFLLDTLGGWWRVISWVARPVPRPIRDCIYRVIARNRKKAFGASEALCPLMPAEYRARFVS